MDPILLIQVIAAEAGLILYGASFFGYGWDEGGRFVIAALVCSFLASIPTVVRDRRFFAKHWGFGLLGVRRRFPFQFFPGRHVEWLNPLGWCFMGILLLHFFWFVMHSAITAGGYQRRPALRILIGDLRRSSECAEPSLPTDTEASG
jgi:hypothetical protein